jgi:hypothetical protein
MIQAATPKPSQLAALAASGFQHTPYAADFSGVCPGGASPERRLLFKSGTVLSLDPAIGDFARADVLVEGNRIVAVAPDLSATATVVDATDMIILPGLVDAHRHSWSTSFRRAIPDADGQVYSNLANAMLEALTPSDIHAATLLGDLGAIHAGITTMLDHCHATKTVEITDAAIQAHQEAGIRCVFSYAPPRNGGSDPEHPRDVERILARHFPSKDQLVTLRLGTRLIAANFALARRMGLGITCDGVFGMATPLRAHSSAPALLELAQAGDLRPDVTIIHGTGFADEVLRLAYRTRTDFGFQLAGPCEFDTTD